MAWSSYSHTLSTGDQYLMVLYVAGNLDPNPKTASQREEGTYL